jgi:hypothetical protein
MNKKGSIIIYGLMLGMTVIILALALAPAVQDFTNTTMSAENLDCDNESISNFDKGSCVAVDLGLFYFIGALILIGGSLVGAKIIF